LLHFEGSIASTAHPVKEMAIKQKNIKNQKYFRGIILYFKKYLRPDVEATIGETCTTTQLTIAHNKFVV